jgi:two-component system response regulator AtoC
MARILLLDDEAGVRRAIERHLQNQGHEVATSGDGGEGSALLARQRFDLVITDLRMPRLTGMELLRMMGEQNDATPVIVLTGYGSIEAAVEAMKLGAADFICKPPQLDEITLRVDKLLERQALVAENRRLRKALHERFGFEAIIGRSALLQRLIERAQPLAWDPDISILLTGESGTGKELLARAIHYNSPRAAAPFVAINCGALPQDLIESELFGHEKGAFTGAAGQKQGLFEAAHRGTLFLDEISAMPAATQVKLLRAIEEREIRRVGSTASIPVDLRIVSASNQNLEEMIEQGTFRQDLYYRLAVATLELPPLRERPGDTPLLVSHFLEKFDREKNRRVAVDPAAMALLEAYPWPGNVRELENLVELLVVTSGSGVVTAGDLPARFRPASDVVVQDGDDLKAATERMTAQFESAFIRRQLDKHHWNITQAAEAMGLSRSGLHAKMKEYGIR